MIAVGDAKQDWGFLQHVETKQNPHPGLLQSKKDLSFAFEGGHSLSHSYWRVEKEKCDGECEKRQSTKSEGNWAICCTGLSAYIVAQTFTGVRM